MVDVRCRSVGLDARRVWLAKMARVGSSKFALIGLVRLLI